MYLTCEHCGEMIKCAPRVVEQSFLHPRCVFDFETAKLVSEILEDAEETEEEVL
jgi:hypothetical protein